MISLDDVTLTEADFRAARLDPVLVDVTEPDAAQP
jgi:hypothetical protein